ncbi:MAG: hypothetical protein K2I05_01890 [Mailhella sp.]|nr:hypothetical protein [Mailhella sp.]
MLSAERWAKERGYGRIILYPNVIMRENLAGIPLLAMRKRIGGRKMVMTGFVLERSHNALIQR